MYVYSFLCSCIGSQLHILCDVMHNDYVCIVGAGDRIIMGESEYGGNAVGAMQKVTQREGACAVKVQC